MKGLISVLIPSYNHRNYVQETIKSVINQTYENIELIVIDDGSKDNTYKKILELKEECEKRFKRVHFETKENEGTIATFNKLISLANGEYIYFIASDDMIADIDALKIQAEFLDRNKKYCLVVGDNQFIDSNSKVCYWDEKQNIVYNKNEAKYSTFAVFLSSKMPFSFNSKNFGRYETFYIYNYIPNGYLVRKSTFDLIPKFTYQAPLEDYFLHLQLSKYGKYKFINKILFSYRWHGANTMSDTDKVSNLYKLTRQYEFEKNISALDMKNVPINVFQTKMYGAKYFSFGIPFLLNVDKFKNHSGNKTKILTLLGVSFKI